MAGRVGSAELRHPRQARKPTGRVAACLCFPLLSSSLHFFARSSHASFLLRCFVAGSISWALSCTSKSTCLCHFPLPVAPFFFLSSFFLLLFLLLLLPLLLSPSFLFLFLVHFHFHFLLSSVSVSVSDFGQSFSLILGQGLCKAKAEV
jgi:hypothetical protein